MKVAEQEFSRELRKDTAFLDFVNNITNLLNFGRYQMRVVSSVPTHTGDEGEFLLYISSTVRRFYFWDNTNSTWQFIEWNNSGLGQATIVATVSLTEQASSIGTTTLYTPAAAGMYRVSVYHLITTAGAGGTLDTTIGWTDDESAKTSTPAAQLDLTVDQSAASGSVVSRATAAAITYATTVAGASGSPKYSLFVVVERLT